MLEVLNVGHMENRGPVDLEGLRSLVSLRLLILRASPPLYDVDATSVVAILQALPALSLVDVNHTCVDRNPVLPYSSEWIHLISEHVCPCHSAHHVGMFVHPVLTKPSWPFQPALPKAQLLKDPGSTGLLSQLTTWLL